jgi:acyl-coenzyme A synthetase/AMP-(fatty) acid ligase
MPLSLALDETVWGLPGSLVAPNAPGDEAFSITPLLSLLRAAASRGPDAIALVSQTDSLCYGDLLRKVQSAARAIAVLVPAGRPVACLLPRTPDGIAGLLGCLVSGRLCMVMDPANPAERQAALLRDAAPAALLLAEPLQFADAAPALMLHEALAGRNGSEWQADRAYDPDAPFVVYFTSGSSGRPKGIVHSARTILYNAANNVGCQELTPDDRLFSQSTHLNPGALSTIIAALARGARLVLADVASVGASAVLRLIGQQMTTCAIIYPTLLRVFFRLERARSAFRALRMLRAAAAPLFREDVAAWRPLLPADCAIWHAYSSTEGLFVAAWVVPVEDRGAGATMAAGMRQPGHEYALLDADGRRAELGGLGELALQGRYLPLGEWRGGRLVAGRMAPIPGRPGWRSLHTGDMLRLQPDGLLRFAGRADRMLKINGFRVEPAEIEAILRSEPGVADAAVVSSSAEGRVSLHGFVAASDAAPAALITALRQRVAATLPTAFMPARLTVLDRLPTLPSGKIDYVSLSRWTQPRENAPATN